MKPYYEDEWVTLYHADCREVLPQVSADVAVTDPPYGIGLIQKTSAVPVVGKKNRRPVETASVTYDDDPQAVRKLVGEVMPLMLSRVDRAVVFPGPASLWAYPEPTAIGCVFTPNGAGRSPWGFQCMHPVLFYGRDPYLVDGRGSRPNSMRTEQPNKEKIDHPCPKPLRWMTWAVARASREGETVIDPFAGSGTTLVAAKALGRKSIGVELEERYCELAVQRLAQQALPLAS